MPRSSLIVAIALLLLLVAERPARSMDDSARQYAAVLLARGHLFEIGWIAVCRLRDQREAERRAAGLDHDGSAHIDVEMSKLSMQLRAMTGRRPNPRCSGPVFDAVACDAPCSDERRLLARAAEAWALKALLGVSLEREQRRLRARLKAGEAVEAEQLAGLAGALIAGDAGL